MQCVCVGMSCIGVKMSPKLLRLFQRGKTAKERRAMEERKEHGKKGSEENDKKEDEDQIRSTMKRI